MTSKNTRTVLALSALALLITGGLLYAGPLTPPAGPVTSTYKTLAEVEPRTAISATNTPADADSLFKITQPGSYYLTGNITGVMGKHGIEIAAVGVTLDLNGFSLRGVAGSLDAVTTSASGVERIAVLNGTIREWGGDGIDLATNGASVCRVERVLANENGGSGIRTGFNGTISFCAANRNGVNGIAANQGAVITNCSAYQNDGNGISANGGTLVVDCVARFNTLDGIICSSGCVIRGNACSNNGNGGDAAGIHVTGTDNRIEGNNCTGADRGIAVDVAGNIIIRNTCSGNTINWVIVANNVVGPFLDRTAPASAAISGNSAPDSTGSTHPNANFTY